MLPPPKASLSSLLNLQKRLCTSSMQKKQINKLLIYSSSSFLCHNTHTCDLASAPTSTSVAFMRTHITESSISSLRPDLNRLVMDTDNEKTHILENVAKTPDQERVGVKSDDQLSFFGFFGPSLNYVNAIIGSGILGTAYAFKCSGLLLGLVALALVAVMTDYSLYILIKSGEKLKVSTYQDLVRECFGTAGFVIVTFIQFCFPFIAMMSYNIIVGDTATKVIIRVAGIDHDSIFAQREFTILIATIFVTLPLSLYRSIDKLENTSGVSLLIVAFIGLAILIRSFTLQSSLSLGGNEVMFRFSGFSQSFGILAFAFVVHHNALLVYQSLEKPTIGNWANLTHCSVLSSSLAMIIFGTCGYMSFREHTQGDILNNYCWSDDLMTFCRFIFTITVLLTYPIELFVVREVLNNVVERIFGKNLESNLLHIVVTISLVVLITLLSFTTKCLGVVLSINGLIAAVPLAFIFPGLCAWKVSGEPNRSKESWMPLSIAVFGVLVVINGLYGLIADSDNSCEEREMAYCNRTIV